MIESLESQLETEQQRNQVINAQFKQVVKDKEKEIQRLKTKLAAAGSSEENGADVVEAHEQEVNQLKRRLEEFEILNAQKDSSVQVMMQQLQEAEDLRDKVEAQERINTEKLMFELAGRIEAHEKIDVKLQEM